MKKKLTLTIEESVKNRAKQFADQHDTSVSDMVEKFLDSVTREETGFTPEPGSWTESIIGVAKVPSKYKGMNYKEVKEKEILEPPFSNSTVAPD